MKSFTLTFKLLDLERVVFLDLRSRYLALLILESTRCQFVKVVSELVDLIFKFAASASLFFQITFQARDFFVQLSKLVSLSVACFFIETD